MHLFFWTYEHERYIITCRNEPNKKERNMQAIRSSIVLIVVALLCGLIAGYQIWGKKEEKKLDVRQLLSSAIQEVEVIEKENHDLKSRLQNMKDSKGEAERLSAENSSLKEQLQKMQQDNTQMESLFSQMKTELSAVKEKRQTDEGLQTLSEDLKVRVSELEKENQDLRSILQKIGSLTQEQKEVGAEDVLHESAGTAESTGRGSD
jgi:DNA repair exonuclease SbcCD ATPase subunit